MQVISSKNGNSKEAPKTSRVEYAPFDMAIEIDYLVYQKVMHWINKSDFEVSGLGKVIVDRERNVMRVIDACLVKQENTSATTELDGDAIGKAMFEMKDAPGELRWWWHSHVNMGVFWSGTDDDAIKMLGGGSHEDPVWFCMTVLNKKQEMRSAYVQNHPMRLIHDNIGTRIKVESDIVAGWDSEYDKNVIEKPRYSYSSGSYGIHSAGYQKMLEEMGMEDDEELFKSLIGKQEADKMDLGTNADEPEEEETEQITLDELFKLHEKGEIETKELHDGIRQYTGELADDGDDDYEVIELD